jgi:transposase
LGNKKPRPRRPFTDEFKAETVQLYRLRRHGDRPTGQIARQADLTQTAANLHPRGWVKPFP